MSKKGEAKKVKSLNAPRAVRIARKENTWTTKTRSGPHKRNDSVSLVIALRDIAKIAKNSAEVKKIVNDGLVLVNGKVRKDALFAIGLFDVITIPVQKLSYRVLFDKKRRIILKEMENESNEKVVKIVGKTMTKNGLQVNTDDGRVIMNDKTNVGDSLKISMPENKVEKVLALKDGALVYITNGAHCANTATIKGINEGAVRKEKLVKVEIKGKEYETVLRNVIVIGEKSSELKEIN